MRRTHLVYQLIFIGLILVHLSCDRASSEKAELQIHFRDSIGNPIVGAQVKLYSTSQNRFENINVVSEKYSDANGNVHFTGLNVHRHFWLAEKGCLNNKLGFQPERAPMRPDVLNMDTTTLMPTGTLRVNNNSADSFTLHNVMLLPFGIKSGETKDLVVPAWTLLINVRSIPTGANKDTSISFFCGETNVLNLPF